jgi:hypothetical protein
LSAAEEAARGDGFQAGKSGLSGETLKTTGTGYTEVDSCSPS